MDIKDPQGNYYCWGERLAHDRLSMLTRREYRCGCQVLLADGGYIQWEAQCDAHKGAQQPPKHTYVNMF